MTQIPDQPTNSFRVTLTLTIKKPRLDVLLIEALRNQKDNFNLKNISRGDFKKLFANKKVLIKGQPAKPASAIAQGTTYIDILLD